MVTDVAFKETAVGGNFAGESWQCGSQSGCEKGTQNKNIDLLKAHNHSNILRKHIYSSGFYYQTIHLRWLEVMKPTIPMFMPWLIPFWLQR